MLPLQQFRYIFSGIKTGLDRCMVTISMPIADIAMRTPFVHHHRIHQSARGIEYNKRFGYATAL